MSWKREIRSLEKKLTFGVANVKLMGENALDYFNYLK